MTYLRFFYPRYAFFHAPLTVHTQCIINLILSLNYYLNHTIKKLHTNRLSFYTYKLGDYRFKSML